MRVGILERDKPILLLTETPEHRPLEPPGLMGSSVWEEMGPWSLRGRRGENPGGMKTQERIGSIPGLTPPGWLYGFLFRLKPLKTDSSFPDVAFWLSSVPSPEGA